MKYINAEKLKEIVDRVYKQYVYDYGISAAGSNMRWIYDAIDSLQHEQSEIDLEKEIIRVSKNKYFDFTDWKSIARHFFELGLQVNNPITAADRGMAEEIIINLKRVEQDYHIDLTREMDWLRNKTHKL